MSAVRKTRQQLGTMGLAARACGSILIVVFATQPRLDPAAAQLKRQLVGDWVWDEDEACLKETMTFAADGHRPSRHGRPLVSARRLRADATVDRARLLAGSLRSPDSECDLMVQFEGHGKDQLSWCFRAPASLKR